ncbi:MAG TPA: G5 domain-containing protein [Candidatus Saccharimonadales bacterium]|nr:G5 domain-containing protein [Candidatus Saccharimonadales bacterium]
MNNFSAADVIAICKRYSRLLVLIAVGLVIGAAFFVHYLLLPRYSKIVPQQYSIVFTSTTNQDCDLNTGTNQVVTKGANGTGLEKYRWNYIGNRVVSKQKVSDVVIKQPVTEVINQGAKNPNPPNYSDLSSALASQSNPCVQQEQLSCALTNIYSAEGKTPWTLQQYNTYLALNKKNGCTPEPYCLFNISVPCVGTNTSNSSGYDAGYAYAEQYQICDSNYDNGNSQDFNDGVNAWTADNCTDGQPN